MSDGPQHYPDWFERLAEKWRQRLIPDWRVHLMPNPIAEEDDGEDGPIGQSQSNACYRRLNLFVAHDCGTRRDAEETLVHEMLHALVEPIDDAYEPALQHMGKFERAIVERAAEAAREHLIERLATELVALDHRQPAKYLQRGRRGFVR